MVHRVGDDAYGRRLTDRELQIIALASNGLDMHETGAALYITYDTVHTIRRHAFRKLGARNAAHAVGILYRTRVLPVNPQVDTENPPADRA